MAEHTQKEGDWTERDQEKQREEIERMLKRIPVEELASRAALQADSIRKYRYQKASPNVMQSMRNAAELYGIEQGIKERANARITSKEDGLREVPVKYVVDEEAQAYDRIIGALRRLSVEAQKRTMDAVMKRMEADWKSNPSRGRSKEDGK